MKNSFILSDQLVSRGYDKDHINKVFNMVSLLDREKLLKYRVKDTKNFSKSIFFKNIFDKNISNIDSLSKNVFKEVINKKEDLKNVDIFIVNKMQPNLKCILINDFRIPQVYKNFYKKCIKKRLYYLFIC